jgi:hypothetical protein
MRVIVGPEPKTTGVRCRARWAKVVSNDALALRDWLLTLGFTQDLPLRGESDGTIHHSQLDWPEGRAHDPVERGLLDGRDLRRLSAPTRSAFGGGPYAVDAPAASGGHLDVRPTTALLTM